jgi:excinuclease UvrABC helicase subunit UvrB
LPNRTEWWQSISTRKAAKNLEFEKAALLRDHIIELRKDEELLSPLTRFK